MKMDPGHGARRKGMRMDENREHSPDSPLYLRLFESIRHEINSGQWEPGSRLPSIRQLASDTGVSVGTVRHVYELLAREGFIRTEKGRGSFVSGSHPAEDPAGRKERALEAIDLAIGVLTDLGFTAREIGIFFELRLRQKEEATRPIRAAIVASTPEERSIINRSMETATDVQFDRILYSDVTKQPARLANYDLAIVPARLQRDLENLTGSSIKVLPVVLAISRETLLACRGINESASVGVLTVSRDFVPVLKEQCGDLLAGGGGLEFALFGDPGETSRFLKRHEVILVSPDYANLVGKAEASLIRDYSKAKRVIRAHFDCDQGSLLYLTQAIKKKYRELRDSLSA